MTPPRSHIPLATISPNIQTDAHAPEKSPQSKAQEALLASARVSQNARSDPVDMDPNSSDSSYERHMLEQIRLHREAMLRNGRQVPFARAQRYDPSRFIPSSDSGEDTGRRTVAALFRAAADSLHRASATRQPWGRDHQTRPGHFLEPIVSTRLSKGGRRQGHWNPRRSSENRPTTQDIPPTHHCRR